MFRGMRCEQKSTMGEIQQGEESHSFDISSDFPWCESPEDPE